MAIRLMKQRPPTKKMGRKQRKGSKSNPGSGVQWANWLDDPSGAPGGGGGTPPPGLGTYDITLSPDTLVLGQFITITITAVDAEPYVIGASACTVWELNPDPEALACGGASSTTSITFDPNSMITMPPLAPGTYPLHTYVFDTDERSRTAYLTITAAAEADPTSSWTKAQIIQWLVEHDVIVDEDAVPHFTKAELLDIVEAYLNGDQDTVDDLLGG